MADGGEAATPTPTSAAATRLQIWIAVGSMVIASVIFAGSGVAGRAAAGHVPPMALSFWRWAIAFVVLAAVFRRPLWRGRAIVMRNLPLMGAFALFGVVGFSVPYYIGLEVTPAVNAAVLNASGPILTLFLSMLFLGARVTAIQVLGIALAVAGALAIVAHGSLAVLLGLAIDAGDVYLLAAFLSWAIYVVMFKWRPAGLEEMGFLAAMMGVSTVMMAPLYAWEIVVQGRTFELDESNLFIIGYTALFPSVLGYICWSNAIKVLGPNTAALSQYLSPVFGIFLAVLILGESVETFHLAGIVLVFAGIFLAGRRGMG